MSHLSSFLHEDSITASPGSSDGREMAAEVENAASESKTRRAKSNLEPPRAKRLRAATGASSLPGGTPQPSGAGGFDPPTLQNAMIDRDQEMARLQQQLIAAHRTIDELRSSKGEDASEREALAEEVKELTEEVKVMMEAGQQGADALEETIAYAEEVAEVLARTKTLADKREGIIREMQDHIVTLAYKLREEEREVARLRYLQAQV